MTVKAHAPYLLDRFIGLHKKTKTLFENLNTLELECFQLKTTKEQSESALVPSNGCLAAFHVGGRSLAGTIDRLERPLI